MDYFPMSWDVKKYYNISVVAISTILCLWCSSCSEELDEIIEPQILNAPSQLEAAGLSEEGLHLSWNDNSLLEEGYLLEKKPDQYHNVFDTLAILPANTISFIDTSISFDTTRIVEYRVCAYKKNTKSKHDKISYTAGAFRNPGNLKMAPLEASSIKLSWDDESFIESGYIIEKKEGTGDFYKIAELAENATEFIDDELDQSKIYTYRVAARFKNILSGFSNNLIIKFGFNIESSTSIPAVHSYLRTIKLIPGTDRILIYSGDAGWPEPTDHVTVYNFQGQLIYELPGRQSTSSVSPEGKIIATTRVGSDINIWDAAAGTFIRSIKRINPELPPRAVAVSERENLVAIFELSKDVAEGYLRVHNLTDGSLKWERKYTSIFNTVLTFTKEGNLIYTTESRNLRLVKASNDSLIYGFNIRESKNANFSKTEKYVIVLTSAVEFLGTTSDLYVWDLERRYLKEKMIGINPSDAIFIENGSNEPELRYAFYSQGWRITQGGLTSPLLQLGVKNLIFVPDTDLVLGNGFNTPTIIYKLKKTWISE